MHISDRVDEYEDREKRSIHSMSPVVGYVFLFCILALFGIICLIDGILPKPLHNEDEKDFPDAFITERAVLNLQGLTEIGPRITGSYENEVLAVDFLVERIGFIQRHAHSNQHIELSLQTVSGSYYLPPPYNGINAYGKVQNVIVKVHSKNESQHSLLVNAHFDSVATSPGGSDDGIMCAVMLEIIYKLSQSPECPQHNVIFLFNGAEETPLHASHGFITKHKWANETKVVVNLEAAGAGGKEILFQAGPGQPWLLKYYQKVPHPNGQAAGEELFQTGLIPSGTDFKIFKDFGHMIGLDLAFDRNGYRYHTKYDDFDNIPLGSYQHAGDNALSLVRNLANAPELINPKEQASGSFVFYDIFGLFLIIYSKTVAAVINIIISILSVVVALKTFYDFGLRINVLSFKHLCFTLLGILLGWIAAGICIIMIALIIDGLGFSLSWYRNPWLILGLYVMLTFACCCGSILLLNHFYKKKNISISVQSQIQLHLVRLIWTAPLFIGTLMGIRAVYGIMMPVLFQTLSAAIIQSCCIQYSVKKWKIIYILGTILPTMFLMKGSLEVFGLLIPICGRIGSDRNADMYIAVLSFLMTLLITSFYFPLITLIRKPLFLLIPLYGVCFIFFIIVFTPLGFPYSGDKSSPAPQRFWIYHLKRDFRNDTNQLYKSESGFFLLNMDRNSPGSVKKYIGLNETNVVVQEDCKSHLLCGFPISTPRMVPILYKSTWIPAETPIFDETVDLILNSKTNFGMLGVHYDFTATGPSQLLLYVSPRKEIQLINTNLVKNLSSDPIMWNDRPLYLINYVWGKENTPLNFTLDFEVPFNWSKPIFDIAVTGSYKDDKVNNKTMRYTEFLNKFPEWADVTAWLGMYQSWVY